MARKILVTDDEPLICSSIIKALSKIGYLVTASRNRDEFLKALGAEIFDLIILDIHVGDITKEEIVEISRARYGDIKFLIISGSQYSEDFNFLEKPFRIDELRNRVRDILDDHS
jgi:DNA-binding response OmpR family regulator